LGVWIHTDARLRRGTGSITYPRYMWTWTPENKWVMHDENDLSLARVKAMSHIYTFPLKSYPFDIIKCLGNIETGYEPTINDITLKNIQEEFFETFEVEFDTRNYTIHNNFEYLEIIPVPEKYIEYTDNFSRDKHLVHDKDTKYYVEIFFLNPMTPSKYLLINNIHLEDSTLRDWAGIGTGHGIETSGIPLRKFVYEDKLYLNKENLRDVLQFFDGLNGTGGGVYATPFASRVASITSGTMEVSGGSRLNYRISPNWGVGGNSNTQANYNNYESLEINN